MTFQYKIDCFRGNCVITNGFDRSIIFLQFTVESSDVGSEERKVGRYNGHTNLLNLSHF